MSETNQFWQYAKEAILSVGDAKTDQDSGICLSLPEPGRKRHYKIERVF
jgi:hypothetical protein